MKIKVYLYWTADRNSKDGGRFSVFSIKGMESCNTDYIPCGESEADFDVTDFDPRTELIESLKRKKAAIIAEATNQAESLEEQIQQLLALPNPSN